MSEGTVGKNIDSSVSQLKGHKQFRQGKKKSRNKEIEDMIEEGALGARRSMNESSREAKDAVDQLKERFGRHVLNNNRDLFDTQINNSRSDNPFLKSFHKVFEEEMNGLIKNAPDSTRSEDHEYFREKSEEFYFMYIGALQEIMKDLYKRL